MNKIAIGTATAVIVGVGAVAGWYFLQQGPTAISTLDCATVQGDVDATIAKFPPETKVTYSGLTCDPAADRLAFTEFAVTVQGEGSGPQVRLVFSDLTVTAPNGANATRIFDPAAYGSQPDLTTRLPLVDRVTAAQLAIGPANEGVVVTDLALGKLAARQFAAPPPTTLAGLGRLSGKGVKDALAALSFETLSFSGLKAASGAATIGAFKLGPYDGETVGALEMNDLAAKPPGNDGTLTLGQLSLENVALGTLLRLPDDAFNDERSTAAAIMALAADRVALKGFKLQGFQGQGNDVTLDGVELTKLQRFAFDRFSVTGLSGRNLTDDVEFAVAGMTLAGVDFGAGMQAFIDGADGPDITKMRAESYAISDVGVGKVGGARFTLASLKATNGDYVDDLPTSGSFALDDLVLPAALLEDPSAREPIDALGYQQIVVDSDMTYSFDVATKTLDLPHFRISMKDGGELDLTFKAQDFDIAALQQASASMEPPTALLAAKLVKAAITYRDNSLADRLLGYIAAQQGSSKDEVRDEAVKTLRQQKAAFPGPILGAAIDQLVKFVQNAKSLTIAVEPAQPTSFVAFGQNATKPEALAAQLGLKVTAD